MWCEFSVCKFGILIWPECLCLNKIIVHLFLWAIMTYIYTLFIPFCFINTKLVILIVKTSLFTHRRIKILAVTGENKQDNKINQ